MKKGIRWEIQEIRYQLAKWRASRHIARTDALIRIMKDAAEMQIKIVEAGDE